MRRGSIQTFESLARRHSSNMAQFASNRSEFMTSDLGLNDIEYERKGGFFMTHKKTALVVSAFVVIIIAAGFVGAYIGSIPKEKTYDTMALIDGDVGCDQRVVSSKFSLSDAIRPSRYHIELSPIVKDDPIERLQGRVSIEFLYNGSAVLEEIVLNARRINVTRTHLNFLTSGTSDDLRKSRRKRRRRRRRSPEEQEVVGEALGASLPTTLTLENRTMPKKNLTEDISGNFTSQDDSANLDYSLPTFSTDDVNGTVLDRNKTLGSENPTVKDLLNTTKMDTSMSTLEKSSASETVNKNKTTEIAISQTEIDDEGGFMVLHLPSAMKSGNYLLEIDYEVPIDGYIILAKNLDKTNDEKKFSAVHTNSMNIRNFFPVFDDVKMKAHFSLAIPQPQSMEFFSNMQRKNNTIISDEWVLVTFDETPSISPNNLVVVGTTYSEILGKPEVNGTQVVVVGDKLKQGTAKYLINMADPIIRSLTDFFSVDLPIKDLSIIGVNQIGHNSGNLGLITIQESIYKVTDESPEVTKERTLMRLIKLIGQQWLGGLVNMQNLNDDWVLESSLLYLQHHLLEEINADFNHSTFLMDVQPEAMEVESYTVSRSLQSKLNLTHPNSFHNQEVYAMGACIIRMLHGILSQPEFRAGYRSFVSRWVGGNANVASFWNAMASNSTEDELPEGEISLPEVMKLWTEQSGYPVVTVTRNYETGSAVVHQIRFSYDKLSHPSQHLWYIPLNWVSHQDPHENSEPSFKWIKPQVETTLELVGKPGDNQSWVVFNPTKTGYFRVNYDEENWNLIAEALGQNHQVFAPETRASLIDDVFSLAFVGLVPYSIVFDVISYLPENEMTPEPWSILMHHVIKLNLVLYDSPVYSTYQEYMVKFLSDLYLKVGSQITGGARLTRIAHKLACLFDYPDYLVWAKKSYAGFEKFSGLPINDDVPSYLHKNLLCAFAKFEHELGWQWWQQKFINVTNSEERISLLSSLACFQVPWMLQAVLNDIVYSSRFEESEVLVILESFSNYPAASQTALQFVESNWKNITARYPKSCKIMSAFLDASSTGFTGEKDVEDSFRDKNYESLKKVGYVTALLEAKANAFVSFLQTSFPEFHSTIANRTSF